MLSPPLFFPFPCEGSHHVLTAPDRRPISPASSQEPANPLKPSRRSAGPAPAAPSSLSLSLSSAAALQLTPPPPYRLGGSASHWQRSELSPPTQLPTLTLPPEPLHCGSSRAASAIRSAASCPDSSAPCTVDGCAAHTPSPASSSEPDCGSASVARSAGPLLAAL